MIAVYIDHTVHMVTCLLTLQAFYQHNPLYKRMMAGEGEVNMPA